MWSKGLKKKKNRRSYMSDHVLLNLLNKFGKEIKCEACPAFYLFAEMRGLLSILSLFATSLIKYAKITITHVFSCINICRGPRMLFEHEADRPSVQHHWRDPASVNAMKQACVIVIFAYFTLFQLNSH